MTYDLFDPRSLARSTDPETSHRAAAEIAPTLRGRQAWALGQVRANPGRTANELARLAGLSDPRTLNRRLCELRTQGLVKNTHARRCEVSGRQCMVWEPGEGQPRQRPPSRSALLAKIARLEGEVRRLGGEA